MPYDSQEKATANAKKWRNKNKEHYHLYVKSKIRYVDPLVLVNNSPQRLSEIAPKFKHQLAQHRKSAAQGVYVFVYPQ